MITPDQEKLFRDHLRAIDARETCPICDAGRSSVKLLDQVSLIARVCSQCGHALLFSPEPLGLQLGHRRVASGYYQACLVPRDRASRQPE
jgi:hypothetical protein